MFCFSAFCCKYFVFNSKRDIMQLKLESRETARIIQSRLCAANYQDFLACSECQYQETRCHWTSDRYERFPWPNLQQTQVMVENADVWEKSPLPEKVRPTSLQVTIQKRNCLSTGGGLPSVYGSALQVEFRGSMVLPVLQHNKFSRNSLHFSITPWT